MDPFESRISLRNLRLIDAVEREGSFARAADRLNMTQSAVTKALQDVEATAGVPLFTRTNRGAVPTPYGELLARHARVLIAQLQRANRELIDLKDGSGGTVAVGTLPSAAGGLLPAAIAQVLAGRPRLRITIVEGLHEALTTQLRRGELDVVVGRLPQRRMPPDIAQDILGPDRARLVVRPGHPLCARPAAGLAGLRDLPWILPPPDTTLRRLIDEAFHAAGLAPPVPSLESLSFLTNRALLLAGDFVTVWPHHLAAVEARQGQVACLDIELPATERPIGVWWRAEAGLSPAARLITEALRQGFGAERGCAAASHAVPQAG